MRLFPDSPFLLFYRDQGVNYWLLQSFSSTGSVTTTVVAKEPVPASQVKPSITQCIPHASGHLRLRSAFLLSPSAHCLHTLLQQSHQESFIAALFHQTACEASADLDLTPASSTACDLLLRYAPQPSSAPLLEADRWSEELAALRRNVEHPGEWRAVKTDEAGVAVGGGCEAQATDYASFLYAKGCACASAAELVAVMKQYLLAIPAQTPTPSLPSSNTTRLAEAVRRGLECVKQCLLCETEAQKEPLLQAWQEEVDALAELAELPALWQEAGVHSLQRRVAAAFSEKKLLVNSEVADAKSGLLQLQQSLRLLGYVNLLECFVPSHESFSWLDGIPQCRHPVLRGHLGASDRLVLRVRDAAVHSRGTGRDVDSVEHHSGGVCGELCVWGGERGATGVQGEGDREGSADAEEADAEGAAHVGRGIVRAEKCAGGVLRRAGCQEVFAAAGGKNAAGERGGWLFPVRGVEADWNDWRLQCLFFIDSKLIGGLLFNSKPIGLSSPTRSRLVLMN